MIEAARLIQQHQFDDALVALLDVWRATREPRVADLIDLVSARVASAAPIPGKTVTERDDAWRAIAKKKNPLEVPRLLAALWPKQWRDARPLLDLLDRFPDDPRIAARLVSTLADPPYTSGASDAFYKLVVASLCKLGDRRGLATLASVDFAGAREAIAAIEKRKVAAIDEDAMTNAEAYFASDVNREAADAERGDALLAAIYAAPDDDAVRAVYADWLTERGDKRGELITLQLARGDGKATKRELELLHEHARTWAGALGKAFEPESLVFDRGFFAGGELRASSIAAFRDDPAARLIRVLECYESALVVELVDHLPSLRSLSTNADAAARIALRPLHLTKLGCSLTADDVAHLDVLAACPGLVALRELQLYCHDCDWLIQAPVLDRIEQLTLWGRVTRELVSRLLGRVSSLLRIELRRDEWTMSFVRATPSDAFDSCRLSYPERDRYGVARTLVTTLDVLPERLKRIEIDPGEHALDERRRAIVEPALARFDATIIVPWKASSVVVEDAPVLTLHLTGRGLLDAALLPATWDMLASMGQRYNALVVGSGKALKPLGDNPLARLTTWAVNERTSEVTLRNTARSDRALLSAHRPDSRYSDPTSKATEIDLVARDRVDAIPSWFARLAKLVDASWALCDVPQRPRTFAFFDRKPVPIGWLSVVPATIAERYPVDTVAGDGVEVVREAGVTVLVTAPTPAEATDERVALVAARMRALTADSV